MTRPPRILPTTTRRLVVFHWPCGCVARDRRDGPRIERCDGTACSYSPTRPAGTRVIRP